VSERSNNLPASVAARLLDRAKLTGDDYQVLLTSYCLERFLYRLGESSLRDRFLLKGAMLLRLWSEQPYRATRDLDLLRRGDGAEDAIVRDLRSILATSVPDDAIAFDAESIRVEDIRQQEEYSGKRVTMLARCGRSRLPLQIDLGLGDAVWPAPRASTYPALLGMPAPRVLTYPREAVVAEKLEALAVLGERNSRIKDFFDLHFLATRFAFERVVLAESVRRTFERRRTPLPAEAPIGLTAAYWQNPSRPAQVRAFARRAGIGLPASYEIEYTRVLGAFLLPVLEDLRAGGSPSRTWNPGGPWN